MASGNRPGMAWNMALPSTAGASGQSPTVWTISHRVSSGLPSIQAPTAATLSRKVSSPIPRAAISSESAPKSVQRAETPNPPVWPRTVPQRLYVWSETELT